jgi:NAD(P)H-quinone oxidoreductase subunit 6
MNDDVLENVAFFGLAALSLAGAIGVASGQNIVRSAFSLLATFLGVAGLYVLCAADLVAVIQVLVYVGGVLILLLFAVMLTSRIADVKVSNQSLRPAWGLVAFGAVAASLLFAAAHWPESSSPASPATPTTAVIGDALLGPYVLPFEVASVVLLAALLGAVCLARGWGVLPGGRLPAGGEPDARPQVDRPAAPGEGDPP